MDLNESFKALAALRGVSHDGTNPFSVMPNEVLGVYLMHEGKRVNIVKTVEIFFNTPSFICTDVRRFWELLLADPEGCVIDVAKEFRTEIIYE